MFKNVNKLIKPQSRVDLIGLIFLMWVLFPFLVPSLINNNTSSYIVTFLQKVVISPVFSLTETLVHVPENAELGAIAYMLAGFSLLILLINIVVIATNFIFNKKRSLYILRATAVLITLTIVLQQIYNTNASHSYSTKMENAAKLAATFKVSVNQCTVVGSKVSCEITLANVPEDIVKKASLVEVNYGSKQYERYTMAELEEQARKPGSAPVDAERINTYNHIYGLGTSEIINKGTNTITVSTNIDIDKKIAPSSLYINDVTLYARYDKYPSPALELYLVK